MRSFCTHKKRFVSMMMRLTDHERELLKEKLMELADGEGIPPVQNFYEKTAQAATGTALDMHYRIALLRIYMLYFCQGGE